MDIEIPVGCTADVAVPSKTHKYNINGRTHRVSEPFVRVKSGKYSLAYGI